MATVVIVEDYADLGRVLVRSLKLLGHVVEAVAGDGLSGIVAALASRPTAELVDIGLPGISDYEVAAWLRQEGLGRGKRLVAMTGGGEDWTPGRAAGFAPYLMKPMGLADLDPALRDVPTT